MLIQLAIADAYGAAFEFTDRYYPNFIKQNNDLCYHQHPGRPHENILPGHYTDDTQMSIAIVNALLESKAPTSIDYIDHFVTQYYRDPRQGYGKRIKAALDAAKAFIEKDPLHCIGTGSFIKSIGAGIGNANGCVMRTLPLGMLPTTELVIRNAIVQASTTHATYAGIRAAIMVSLAAHGLYHQKTTRIGLKRWLTSTLKDECGEFLPPKWRLASNKEIVPCDAIKTAYAAIFLLTRGNIYMSMSQLLIDSVDMGGDTDSVAAVTIGLASLCDDVIDDLPSHLYNKLENKKYGATYLRKLESKFFRKYPRS